jgi:RNA polymerase sigma factor (sigma-70 family)
MHQVGSGHGQMSVNAVTDPDDWVDRHGDALYRYALLRLRSPDLAADVVQETFLEAFRARSSFSGRSSERTWLVGILRHMIMDHLRRVRREPPAGNGVSANGMSEPPLDVFNACLSKLPQGLADAFFLRELDDLGADEVQQILGITPANLWKRLHRACVCLRRCLESGWFGAQEKTSSLKGQSR